MFVVDQKILLTRFTGKWESNKEHSNHSNVKTLWDTKYNWIVNIDSNQNYHDMCGERSKVKITRKSLLCRGRMTLWWWGIKIWQRVKSTVGGGCRGVESTVMGRAGGRLFLLEDKQIFGYWGILHIPSAGKTLLIVLIAWNEERANN